MHVLLVIVGGIVLLWPAVVPWLFGVWLLVLTGTGYVGLATVCAVTALKCRRRPLV